MKQQIIFLFLVLTTCISAQTKIYKLKEYYSRKDTLSAFFNKLDYKYRSDTVCIMFMMPGSCPRCEGCLNPFITELRKYKPHIDVMAFVFSDNKEASTEYMNTQQFATNRNFFINKDFIYKNFKVSTNKLMTPFMVMLNVKTGLLLNSEGMLGYTVNNENVLKFLTEVKSREELYEFKESTGTVKSNPAFGYDSLFKLQVTSRINIPTSEFKIADVDFFDVKNPSVFKFTDGITHEVFMFDEKKNKLLKIQPSAEEERLFIKIPEDEFMGLKKMNVARSMYFKSAFSGDSVITISASLPEIYYTKPYAITYNNKAGLIKKNIYTDSIYSFVSFKFHDSVFSISHPSASFAQTGDHIFVPVKKGWPSVGVDDKYLKDSLLNPFAEKFYEKTPLFAVFNLKGNFVTYAGNLSHRIKKAHLGYLATTSKTKIINNKYYFTAGCDGIIYVADDYELKNITDSISIYQPRKNFKYTSAIDKTTQPMEYMLDLYNNYFQYRILDFTGFNNIIYITVKNDQTGAYYLYKYRSDTKKLTYTILENTNDMQINDAKFFASGEKALNLFTISSNTLFPYIVNYKLN